MPWMRNMCMEAFRLQKGHNIIWHCTICENSWTQTSEKKVPLPNLQLLSYCYAWLSWPDLICWVAEQMKRVLLKNDIGDVSETNRGRVTHIYGLVNLDIIDSNNGFSPVWCPCHYLNRWFLIVDYINYQNKSRCFFSNPISEKKKDVKHWIDFWYYDGRNALVSSLLYSNANYTYMGGIQRKLHARDDI